MVAVKYVLVLFALGTSVSVNAGGRKLQGDVLSEVVTAVDGIPQAIEGLLQDVLGAGESFLTSIPNDIASFDWGSLKNFSIEQPITSLLASLKDISLPSSLLQAETELTDFIDQFCTFEEFTPGTTVPSSCVGRQLQLVVQPWSCALIDVAGTIQCTPAYIQLVTAPAYCAAKHESAAVYKGKTCKLQQNIGESWTKTVGAISFSLDIPGDILQIPQSIASALLGSGTANATATSSVTVTVPAGQTAIVTGTAAGNAAVSG